MINLKIGDIWMSVKIKALGTIISSSFCLTIPSYYLLYYFSSRQVQAKQYLFITREEAPFHCKNLVALRKTYSILHI